MMMINVEMLKPRCEKNALAYGEMFFSVGVTFHVEKGQTSFVSSAHNLWENDKGQTSRTKSGPKQTK